MNYTKPEVAEMGQAVNVIELGTIKTGKKLDFNRVDYNATAPAYDLDE
jgi:hypothetical protein